MKGNAAELCKHFQVFLEIRDNIKGTLGVEDEPAT